MEVDRNAVSVSVEEINRSLGASGLQVNLLDWENDARPSVGTDGQDVINRQLCDRADLGVVLIHDRIGSPTPRYPSGTVEEAEIILDRIEQGDNVDLLVFFRRPSISVNKESLDNLRRVLEFRNRL
jgi:hypothetical protein